MASIGVAISTFGSDIWAARADTAEWSAENQGRPPDQIVKYHTDDGSLGYARNQAAGRLNTDFIIFLDADDLLHFNYVGAMESAIVEGEHLYRPATQGFYGDGSTDDEAVMIPRADLRSRNFCVIGTMVRRADFEIVHGFDEELTALEDWELFLHMHSLGCDILDVPEAIYMVGVNEGSRNSRSGAHGREYGKIKQRYRQR